MHVVLLKFSNNKSRAGQFMGGHKAWIQRGFDDGVFLLEITPSRSDERLAFLWNSQ